VNNIICCITFAQQTCNDIVGFIEGLIKVLESFKKKKKEKKEHHQWEVSFNAYAITHFVIGDKAKVVVIVLDLSWVFWGEIMVMGGSFSLCSTHARGN